MKASLLSHAAFSIGVFICASSFASAQNPAVYSGDTTGGPEWDRALSSCDGVSILGPVTYHEQNFFVDTNGSYDISSDQDTAGVLWDGYLLLYVDSFDPLNPLTNCVTGDDDGDGGIGTSDIDGVALTAGTQYILVTTGFSAGNEGAFTNTIDGPGGSNITLEGTVTYTGDTTGGPEWDRALTSCATVSLLGPVTYHEQNFFVDTNGSYDITSDQDTAGALWDGFLLLYINAFDPLNPLTNCVTGDDDGDGGIGTSDIDAVALIAGPQYILVTTGFSAGNEGAFTNGFDGPPGSTISLGVIVAVEPSAETPESHVLSSAYPNPFNPQSQFTLTVAQVQHVTAELYNMLGQRVTVLFDGRVGTNQAKNITIDGAGLSSGMYIVRVNGETFSDAIGVTLLK